MCARPELTAALDVLAPPEEAGRPALGLRLQEEASGQDPRRGNSTGAGEVSRVEGRGGEQHV